MCGSLVFTHNFQLQLLILMSRTTNLGLLSTVVLSVESETRSEKILNNNKDTKSNLIGSFFGTTLIVVLLLIDLVQLILIASDSVSKLSSLNTNWSGSARCSRCDLVDTSVPPARLYCAYSAEESTFPTFFAAQSRLSRVRTGLTQSDSFFAPLKCRSFR